MTSSIGTQLHRTGNAQRLHFVIVILTGKLNEFIESIAPDNSTTDDKAIRAELLSYAHMTTVTADGRSVKDAYLESIRLMNCYAKGR